jgi:hypothetical protein
MAASNKLTLSYLALIDGTPLRVASFGFVSLSRDTAISKPCFQDWAPRPEAKQSDILVARATHRSGSGQSRRTNPCQARISPGRGNHPSPTPCL